MLESKDECALLIAFHIFIREEMIRAQKYCRHSGSDHDCLVASVRSHCRVIRQMRRPPQYRQHSVPRSAPASFRTLETFPLTRLNLGAARDVFYSRRM
jgi:hypothetical protein